MEKETLEPPPTRWNFGVSVRADKLRRSLVRQIRRDSVENLLDRSLTADLVTVLVPGWVVGRERKI